MKSSRIMPLLGSCLALLATAPAQASTQTGVHVTNFIPNNAGVLLFYVDVGRTDAPACSLSPITWTINITTPAGQTMAASLLTAMVSGLTVDIGGTGVCEFSGSESVGYLAIHR